MKVSEDKLDQEPPRARALFDAYLSLGPSRSLPGLAKRGLASLSYLKKLSAHWRWRERAAQWQSENCLSAKVDDPRLVAEARARQLRDARMMQRLGKAQVFLHLQRNQETKPRGSGGPGGSLAVRFWKSGFDLEDDLLPSVIEKEPEEVSVELKQEEERSQPSPVSLSKSLKDLLRLLRKAGVPRRRLPELRAKLLHWFWLREEDLDTPKRKCAHLSGASGETKASTTEPPPSGAGVD